MTHTDAYNSYLAQVHFLWFLFWCHIPKNIMSHISRSHITNFHFYHTKYSQKHHYLRFTRWQYVYRKHAHTSHIIWNSVRRRHVEDSVVSAAAALELSARKVVLGWRTTLSSLWRHAADVWVAVSCRNPAINIHRNKTLDVHIYCWSILQFKLLHASDV